MRNRQNAVSVCALIVLMAFAACMQGETLPRLEGETLAGKRIVLPDDVHGKIVLLVIGFSKKGGEATGAWQQRFKKDFGTDQRYVTHPVAVLEEAPRFIRGVIISGIRRGTPAGERDHFIVLLHRESDLKLFVAYSSPDEPYLVLLDMSGEVRWRGHGLFREENYTALRDTAKQLGSR